jgi:hypothetical protein
MAEEHKYTIVTPHGDVNLTTQEHHTTYETIELWLKAHQATVASALGLASLAVGSLGVYLTHGRGGPKIR